jgi:histidinol-phosphate/aromatic aminotransferase/cobyric acid decarboxylase-like protein
MPLRILIGNIYAGPEDSVLVEEPNFPNYKRSAKRTHDLVLIGLYRYIHLCN